MDDQRIMAYLTPEEYIDEDIQSLIREYRNPVILLFEFKRWSFAIKLRAQIAVALDNLVYCDCINSIDMGSSVLAF